MKHIDFSKPIRLINLPVKTPPRERILFTKTVIWSKESKPHRDSQTKRRFQK